MGEEDEGKEPIGKENCRRMFNILVPFSTSEIKGLH